jgi:hypothetical protein
MPRIYTVTNTPVAVTAAQDLCEIKGAAGKTLKVRRIECGAVDNTAPSSQMLNFRFRFLPATVTPGTAGTTPTPAKADPGDAAASFTAGMNNTGKATTGGTAVVLWSGSAQVLAGLDYSFINPPVIGPSESGVFELLSTVTPVVTLAVTVTVEETGG